MSETVEQAVAIGDVPRSAGAADSGRSGFSGAEPRALLHCVYISVACAPCECVRVALPEMPKEEVIACPACGRLSTWSVLARGATVRPLPFYQRMRLGEDRKGQSRVPWTVYDTYEREEEES